MFVIRAYAQEGQGAEADVLAPPTEGELHEVPLNEGEAHGTATTEQAGDHGGGVFPPFDTSTFASQLLWLAISFGLFYWFMNRVVMPRLAGIMAARQGRIAGDLERAAAAKTEADAAVAAYEQALAEARATANRIGQEASDKAKADAEAERRQAEAALDARLQEAQASVENVKASAMANVGSIARDAAEAIVRQLTGKDVEPGAVEAAVASAQR
ncbi:MAG TPA: F0F1 ATP synthase subunit B [Mesorhizobium sp.]|jgi:F-type H+-transporting ATPase subunit b|nr:F0F1 ATP synthase subunit B [Mesorhizobium sp.]